MRPLIGASSLIRYDSPTSELGVGVGSNEASVIPGGLGIWVDGGRASPIRSWGGRVEVMTMQLQVNDSHDKRVKSGVWSQFRRQNATTSNG